MEATGSATLLLVKLTYRYRLAAPFAREVARRANLPFRP
jgi:hypothetical protein